MVVATTGIKLLSSLRKTRSKSSLYDTPLSYFVEDDERSAFEWLCGYVENHNVFPQPATFKYETGIQTVITNEPLAYYQDNARKRALYEALLPGFTEIKDALRDQDPDNVITQMQQCLALAADFNGRRTGLTTLADSIGQVVEDFDTAKRSFGLRGIPTGFPFLDEATDGLQNANLYTDVARTGVGKTFMLLRKAKAARDAGFSVLFLTMEMGVVQVARRFFGMETVINPKFLREGRLSTVVEREMKRQAAQLQEADGPPWFWLAGNFKKTVGAFEAAMYETGADIGFADASYLMKPSDRTKATAKHELIADTMQGIHQVAVKTNRPIVQSVQFNRLAIPTKKATTSEEEREDPLSHMSLDKIAGSDEIGQLSALVLGLTPAEKPHDEDQRYAGILKGREGESGWFKYNYQFQPINFNQIEDSRSRNRANTQGEAPNLSYMDLNA